MPDTPLPAPHRQTISYLTRRFRQVGLKPNARHGQNFLVDLNLLAILADAAQLNQQDVVLEVGTGMGSLTALLAARAGRVVTVELDRHLHQMAREELEAFDNITMLLQDALKNKNRIDPLVLQSVQQALHEVPGRTFKLVANLPYNIATPLISNLLAAEPVPDTMTVTIQKELADRIVAAPGNKDYGSLSVWVQSLCVAEVLRLLPPTVFWPRPKVPSAIIQLRHRRDWRDSIPHLDYWHQFVRVIFFHRRKFLRAVAVSAFRDHLDKPAVDRVLSSFSLGPDART
ncbi:MAG TPA: 16S rRNA (adenine(1518)-N(6)/adenine(1519)-N(6))-dimethyltransferase RsmA, partial [Pirellulaceae bacterium]|nr:16S rRNA (adenine(1518)-N(6)/adenine(1519)-N(6))-dimethyltransferase RsmA [Pirellulaceae bacterium]